MLTIFSVPKPFEGHIGMIQRNAIRSWTSVGQACQVIICGDEQGAAEAAAEFGVDMIRGIERNEFGTPLLNSVFQRVEERATHELLCYVNGDLILFPDLLEAVRLIAAEYQRFLLVGDVTNLDLREEIDGDFQGDLRRRAATDGKVRGRIGIDYFVFPRGSMGSLPAFAVGRPRWDNWMIWRARSLRMPVVDASASVLVIHQNHGYGHVAQAVGGRWRGPEGDRNLRLLGSMERAFSLDHATHRLTPAGIVRNAPGTLKSRIHTEVILHSWALPLYRPLRWTYRRLRRASSGT
jgi:hypothetical protein